MAVAEWRAGQTYLEGAVVVPKTVPAAGAYQVQNGSFNGSSHWTFQGNVIYVNEKSYDGGGSCIIGTGGDGEAINDTTFTVVAGTKMTARCKIRIPQLIGIGSVDLGCVRVRFYGPSNNELTYVEGNRVTRADNNDASEFWGESVVEAIAPPGAVWARAGIYLSSTYPGTILNDWRPSGDALAVDGFEQPEHKTLVYRAIQSGTGRSGASEPTWPGTTGQTVSDGTVVWEAITGDGVVWLAVPLAKSGATEPDWATAGTGYVHDGTIDWVADTMSVQGAPQSEIVIIAANKVFVGDGDIVRFCATNDANDWSSESDAGYLPTGLQAVGENMCTAIGLYRGNVVVWTPSSMQVWQVDPDPSRMALIDTIEGIGSQYPQANASVTNDLYFTSRLGVRSVGIAATTGTMNATDVGTPIDELVRAKLETVDRPIAIFYSNASQLWLVCGDEAFIFTMSRVAKVAAWSRYTFPFSIDNVCVNDGKLYCRAGNDVFVLDETLSGDQDTSGVEQPIDVIAQTPWTALGSDGVEKMMDGFDSVISED